MIDARDEDFARAQDAADPLRDYRDLFLLPRGADGAPLIYFAGNSLGLQPRSVREDLDRQIRAWAERGVEAHFENDIPWYDFHEAGRASAARLVGALPHEVVLMNSLTVNLHLMLVSFFRPDGRRNCILIDHPTFPSDTYAVQSQLVCHGLKPRDHLLHVRPRGESACLSVEDVEEALEEHGVRIRVVLFAGINFVTGQYYDLARVTRAAHAHGCLVGLDLAHAVGNVPLALHDWGVDFAVWCNYKYCNSGPGAVAGCFVHERHACNPDLPRFAGWWGNDPDARFQMHLLDRFVAVPSADGWQLSNPPILALAPVVSSHAIFDRATMPALREKSVRLTGYLADLLAAAGQDWFRVITPAAAAERGCQLSIQVSRDPRGVFDRLRAAGVIGDFRPPDVIRVAPTPLYNTFEEVRAFARILTTLAA